ncbi:MAG TPA: hypothetical protein VHR36_13625 [Pyrinomonadaceae bacterium]|nr:hypothetical protein [Pyrinomonadaceae bacterium]
MKKPTIKFRMLPAAFLVLSAAVFAVAQQSSGTKQNTRPAQPIAPAAALAKPAPSPTTSENEKPIRFRYEFTQPQFLISHIVIEHDQNGHGWITFERRSEEIPYKEQLDLSAAANARIVSLWQALSFLDSTEDYQSSKQFPHLGTMRLQMEQDSRKRTAEFNWTNNKDMSSLVNEYRRAADQALLIFDLSIARENQPLNSPKLMDQLETMLKRNALSDAQQLVPLLKDIAGDEHLPLITRNHATRLLKQIEK